MNMTHLKDVMKSLFKDRNFQIFAWAVQLNHQSFGLTEFQINFPIE